MISHRQVMINIGTAIKNSAEVLTYCTTKFGKGLEVVVGAYPNGIPTTNDAPFCWITPLGNQFTARIIIGGTLTDTNGKKVLQEVVATRGTSANGLIVNGGNKVVEDLRDTIATIIASTTVGAIPVTIRREENDLSHFPLEWAALYVDFQDPVTLDEYIR